MALFIIVKVFERHDIHWQFPTLYLSHRNGVSGKEKKSNNPIYNELVWE